MVAITLVPAMLGFLGLRALPRRHRADPAAPAGGRHASSSERFYQRWIGIVTRHKLLAVLVSTVTLGIVAVPFFSMQTAGHLGGQHLRHRGHRRQRRRSRRAQQRPAGVPGDRRRAGHDLLVLVIRSILVPLVGVLDFLLTVGAALGATVAESQWGWLADLVNLDGTGPLISLTPIIVIGLLFGLAMDYQVFLVSRMHEAHAHGPSALDAIRTAVRQAAPVVVAAAAITFFVFAGFVPSGGGTIRVIAFALAVGIALDAFVVRMILVPATLALLAKRAWWLPRWLRWLPTLDVEGAGLERPGSLPHTDERRELVDAGR